MARARLAWGGAVAALVAVGTLALIATLHTTAQAEHHVQRYLDALARDDLVTAARLAGLENRDTLPLGDEGEPSIQRIITVKTGPNDTVAIEAEYGGDTDAVRVTFHLEPAPPTLGVIPAWRFVTPPVAALVVGVDRDDGLLVGSTAVTTAGPGATESVAVFIPARVTVRLADPRLSAPAQVVRITGASEATGSATTPLLLRAEPSATLVRDTQRQLEAILADCAEQRVLKPAGCPLGLEVNDRVLTEPQWSIQTVGTVAIGGDDPSGWWRIRASAVAVVTFTAQRLSDGLITERSESVPVTVGGTLILRGSDGELVLDPARP